MEKVYISGPISLGGQITGEEAINQRRRVFARAAEKLVLSGYGVVNPMEVQPCADMSCDPGQLSGPPPGIHTWQCWMKHTLKAMLDCSTIALLPGWMDSRGASVEYNLALQLDFNVIYLDKEGDIKDVA